MILIPPKELLSSDSVPQSIELEGSDIKLADTIQNVGVSFDPALYSQQQITFLCRINYLELRRINAIRHYLSEDVTQTNKQTNKLSCAFVRSRFIIIIIIIIIIIYRLTVRIVGAPLMISQPVSSIFPCSPLPSGTWRSPGLSIP